MLQKSKFCKAIVGGVLLLPVVQGCSQESMEVHETNSGAGSPRTSEPGTTAATPPGSEGGTPGGGAPSGSSNPDGASSVDGSNAGAGGPGGDTPSKPH